MNSTQLGGRVFMTLENTSTLQGSSVKEMDLVRWG